jgi:dTDP-4-dehydrorhamnose reductase
MRPLDVLVLGASGFLGRELMRRVRTGSSVLGTYHSHVPAASDRQGPWTPLDVTDRAATMRAVRAFRPRVVVNASVAVSPEVSRARAVIVDGAAHAAQAARDVGASLIQISSDMVFDGESGPFDEAAPPSPIFPYGHAKAEAERSAREAHPDAVIVRCPLLYRVAPPDPSTGTWLRGVREGRGYALFTDEIRCPAPVEDVAQAITDIALALAGGDSLAPVLHLPGPQAISRYAFGRLVLEAHGLDPDLARSAESNTIAESERRPRDLTMIARSTPARFTASIRAPKRALPKAETVAATPRAASEGARRADRAARRS